MDCTKDKAACLVPELPENTKTALPGYCFLSGLQSKTLQAPAKGRNKKDSGNAKAKKQKSEGKGKEEKQSGSNGKVPAAAQALLKEDKEDKGFGNGSSQRGEGSPSTSGSVTSSGRPGVNTNTVSSGIKLDKVMPDAGS